MNKQEAIKVAKFVGWNLGIGLTLCAFDMWITLMALDEWGVAGALILIPVGFLNRIVLSVADALWDIVN